MNMVPDHVETQMRAEGPQGAADWEETVRVGIAHMRAGRPAEAVPLFAAAVSLRPHLSVNHLNLAVALLRTGEHERALATYDHLLAFRPELAAAHHGRGLVLNGLRDRAGALHAFRAALRCDRDAWRSWESVADLTSCEGERLDAVEETARALERRCVQADAPADLYVRCADALIDAERSADAIRFVRKHLTRFPDESRAFASLGRASYRLGAFEDAFGYAAQALRTARPLHRSEMAGPKSFVPARAIEALRAVVAILEAEDLEPFLVAGTLLGFHREGGPLPHDRDVDIGILREPGRSIDIVGIVRAHPEFLLRRDVRSGDRYIALTHKGIGIDIFLYDVPPGHVVCGMSDLPGDIQWRFTRFGLTVATYGGHRWRVPDAPERYLAETYGPGWQRPDPGFASAVSSPALFEVDPHARGYYAVGRAKQAYAMDDRLKAQALLDQSPITLPT